MQTKSIVLSASLFSSLMMCVIEPRRPSDQHSPPGAPPVYEYTLSELPVSDVLYAPRGLPAGPLITLPLSEKREPCAGQKKEAVPIRSQQFRGRVMTPGEWLRRDGMVVSLWRFLAIGGTHRTSRI